MPRHIRLPAVLAVTLPLLGVWLGLPAAARPALARPALSGAAGPSTREAALRAAFPHADRLEPTPFALGESGRRAAEERAGLPIEDGVVSAWTAWAGKDRLGTAYFDTRTVRTLAQTLLVVVSPEGTLASVRVVAFHEPPAYLPPPGWLERLAGRPLDERLWPGRGVDSLTGATLSARAVVAGVRRVLAVHAAGGDGRARP